MGYRAWLIIHDFYGEGKDLKTELTGVSFLGNSVSPGVGHAPNAPQDISVIKQVDDASPIFWRYAAERRPFDKVFILFEKPEGDSYIPVFSWELSDGLLTSTRTSGSYGGKDTPTQTLYFSFTKFESRLSVANDGAQGKSASAQ